MDPHDHGAHVVGETVWGETGLGGAIAAVGILATWWVTQHKYQALQGGRRLRTPVVHEGGFTWVRFAGGPMEEMFGGVLAAARAGSGVMWEGYAVGISREEQKPGVIALWLYGTNDGVGHYAYIERTNTFRCGHGDGHFNLLVHEKDGPHWERRVVAAAFRRIAKDVGCWYEPAITEHDPASKSLPRWTERGTGRRIVWNADRPSAVADLLRVETANDNDV